MSSVTTGLEPEASKALSSFLSRPRVPTAFTEVAYPGVPSQDLEPLKLWAHQLPAPSPEVVHIKMSDVTLRGKSWLYRVTGLSGSNMLPLTATNELGEHEQCVLHPSPLALPMQPPAPPR